MKYLSTIKANIIEVYMSLLVVFGIPALVFMYLGWQVGLTVFVLIQIALCVLALRGKE